MIEGLYSHARCIPRLNRLGLLCLTSLAMVLAPVCPAAQAAPDAATPKKTATQTPTKPKSATVDRSNWKAGVMEIKTDLERGLVEINGKRISSYPLPGPWTLSTGRYTLTLRDGSWNQTRIVDITPGKVSVAKFYRDPANDPDSQSVPDDFEMVPDEPQIEIYHPGAGFNVTTIGYILMGVSALSLGYGVYELIGSSEAQRAAENLPDSQADKRRLDLESAMAASWRSRISLGFGSVALLSGVAFTMFGNGGWLDSAKVKTKTAPVYDDEETSSLSEPDWGLAVTSGGSHLWASWRW